MEERAFKTEGASEVRPMGSSRRLCLCGNSLILATVGASLRRHPHLDVVTLASPSPRTSDLEALAPEVILFDLESERPKAAFALLEAFPDLLIVGISPDSNVVKLWSGKQLRELSTQGLVETIAKQLDEAPTPWANPVGMGKERQGGNHKEES